MPLPDPVSAITSSINVTIKILEITYELRAVDEQTADLLSTTRHVDFMLQHAHRLRRLKAGLLNTSERGMIDTVIEDTENALRGVARLVEPCRVDKATKNAIGLGHRIMWMIRDNPSVRAKHQMLQICYQSLTNVFHCLFSKDVVVIAPIPEVRSEEQPPPYDPQLKELLNWQNRRKGRKSLGEKDCPPEESVDLTNGSRNLKPVATESHCLLAIDFNDDTGTSSLSFHTEASSELFPMPTSNAQPSLLSNNNDLLHPTTRIPEFSSAPVHLSINDSIPDGEKQITPASSPPKTYTDSFGITYDLPKIDSPPFADMIAAHEFNNDLKDGPYIDSKCLAHTSTQALNQAPSSSAAALDTTISTTTWFPPLAHATGSTPASLESNAEDALDLRWFESSASDTYDAQQFAEVSDPGPHSLRASVISDTQPITAYQSDRLDAMARVESIMTRDKKSMSVGQGVIKRGGRSWLAYHATRSDTEHGMNWDG